MLALPTLLFYLFAALAVGAGLWLVFSKNLLHMAFALLLCLLAVAAIYVLLFADFVAVTQLMVYVGGVLVLIVFGLMLSSSDERDFLLQGNANTFWGAAVVIGVVAGLGGLLLKTSSAFAGGPQAWALSQNAGTGKFTTLFTIGQELVLRYVLPFEIASVLLLVALVGAAAITKQNARP
jgi:NADH-quinone oxidoreductase subunit J